MALAPDLYHGATTTEPDEADKLLMSMEMDRAARDMAGAVQYLRERHEVQPKKVGVTAFCMGGGLALKLATIAPVDAAVPFYSFFIPEDADWSRLQGPILGHFAEHDPATAKARTLFQDLERAGVQAEMHVYPGTEHAFFNDDRPEAYRPEAAEQAWERTVAFFRATLR